jgi:hypothetical protein
VSTVGLAAPRNAFGVSVVNPLDGRVMNDSYTGAPVARITSIQRNSAGNAVIFSATGSDDACTNPDSYADSGWQTNDIYFRVDYATHVHVLYSYACNNPGYRLRTIIVACADAGFYISDLRWRWWTDRSAYGVGVVHENDCVPACFDGHFHRYKDVSVRLDHPRFCSFYSDYEFTRLRYRFRLSKPPGTPTTGGSPTTGTSKGCAFL